MAAAAGLRDACHWYQHLYLGSDDEDEIISVANRAPTAKRSGLSTVKLIFFTNGLLYSVDAFGSVADGLVALLALLRSAQGLHRNRSVL